MSRSYPQEARLAQLLWLFVLAFAAIAAVWFALPLTEDTARRTGVLLLSLVGVIAAGLLGRLGVLASAESYRLAEGTASPLSASPAPSMTPGSAPAMSTPLGTTELWFQGRISRDTEGRLNPTAALADYKLLCAANGLPAVENGAFFNMLAGKAKAAGGTVEKVKSNGLMVYKGWSMAIEDRGDLPGPGGEMLSLPYRT
jgi:hypothetical protein